MGFAIYTQDFELRGTLSEFVCGPNCPYYNGVHPVGARANGLQYNAAAIPKYLAIEVAEHVHAKFYRERIRKTPFVELTEQQIQEFNDTMTNIGGSSSSSNHVDGTATKKTSSSLVPMVSQGDSDDNVEEEKQQAAKDDD